MELLKKTIEQSIHEKLEQEIESILEEETKKAVDTLRSRIKEMTGSIASRVASYVDYQYNNDRLIITINTKDLD